MHLQNKSTLDQKQTQAETQIRVCGKAEAEDQAEHQRQPDDRPQNPLARSFGNGPHQIGGRQCGECGWHDVIGIRRADVFAPPQWHRQRGGGFACGRQAKGHNGQEQQGGQVADRSEAVIRIKPLDRAGFAGGIVGQAGLERIQFRFGFMCDQLIALRFQSDRQYQKTGEQRQSKQTNQQMRLVVAPDQRLGQYGNGFVPH